MTTFVPLRPFPLFAVAVSFFLLLMTGCGSSGGSPKIRASSSPKIALLLPEQRTARYESIDKPEFETRLSSICPQCELTYANAQGDADVQHNQAIAAVENGARVLVLDPVDAEKARNIVTYAKAHNTIVIAYDRLIRNADIDFYISIDVHNVGTQQAQSLLNRIHELDKKGVVVMLNGSPTDTNATVLKSAAHSVLDGAVPIGKEFDTPDWSPDNARAEMSAALRELGTDAVAGVLAANDGIASGAIAALRDANVTTMPPVTGQDAELAAVQRIVTGEQFMTIYKPIGSQARTAATTAVAFALDRGPQGDHSIDNGTKLVPSSIAQPLTVTRTSIESTVVNNGMWTLDQICGAQYASDCALAGLR